MTDGPPDPAGARGLQLVPFRALRFDADRLVNLAAVTSPPYDVVDQADIRALETLDPHNVIRLIMPRSTAEAPADRYQRAARLLRRWRADGTLVTDPTPGLYVYEQGTTGSVHRGVLAAVGLAAPEQRVILPHEDVMPGPVDDRLELMAATRANLEPILLTHSGDDAAGEVVDAVLARAGQGPALVDLTSPEGFQHRVWRVGDPADLWAITRAMGRRTALIADGHHRFAAYRLLQRRLRKRLGGGPWDYGLALLVDAQRYPLRLRAIHRSVGALDLKTATARLEGMFSTRRVPLPTEAGPGPLERLVAPTPPAAFAVADGDGRYAVLVTVADEAAVQRRLDAALPPGTPAVYRRLAATLLHHVVLQQLWQGAEPQVGYHHDPEAALRAARRERGVAILLPPAQLDDVLAVAAAGITMPRKSTSFGPKPRSGLVLRTFDLG